MNAKKILAMILAVVLLMTATIAGTIAWLKDDTTPVVNTFTSSDVDIDLGETTGSEYKMVPGATIIKDPVVTVQEGSEACYVFVKIDESTDAKFSDYMEYTVADGWVEVPDNAGVYYRVVSESDDNQEFSVLADNQITVKAGVTKSMMESLNEDNYPTLTFTAYAIQSANLVDDNGDALAVDDISAIWAMAKTSANP